VPDLNCSGSRAICGKGRRMGGKPSSQLGVGTDLNSVANGVEVDVVDIKGPFGEPQEGVHVEQAAVEEFWREQKVVLHLLRRFG